MKTTEGIAKINDHASPEKHLNHIICQEIRSKKYVKICFWRPRCVNFVSLLGLLGAQFVANGPLLDLLEDQKKNKKSKPRYYFCYIHFFWKFCEKVLLAFVCFVFCCQNFRLLTCLLPHKTMFKK